MIKPNIKALAAKINDIDFSLGSKFAGGAIILSGSVATLSLFIIALRLGPISKKAHLWNICVKEEMKNSHLLSPTKSEKVWLSVPNCN